MFRIAAVCSLALLLAGCGGRVVPSPDASAQRLVRVDWYGFESFRIRTSLGLSILTNPFAAGTTEFSPPKGLETDVVLITDEDSSRNYVDGIENTPRVFRGSVGVGANSAAGVRLLGVPVYPNPEQPGGSALSVMYRWASDGLKFAFLGDLPSMPSPLELSRIGPVDILFLPLSGDKLNTSNRMEIIRQLRPNLIIPMGSRTAMARFAGGFASVHRLNGPAALLSKESMPAQQTVLLFR
jgi:hypothetical protein